MTLRRRVLLAGSGALPAALLAQQSRPAGRKVLRLPLVSPETTFDPPQTNTDLNTGTILAHILEAPLAYDYLARPARLVPATAIALPEITPSLKPLFLQLLYSLT